jgi:hypothetical protein
LNDQLSDAISTAKLSWAPEIVVDEKHLDLASVSFIDGARCIDDADAKAVRQPRSGMDERGVSLRQCDRDSGADECAFARRKDDVRRRHEIGSRVTGMGIGRQWHIPIESHHQHVERLRHGARPYATLADVNATPAMMYRERLRVPVLWWLLGLLAAVTIWLTFGAAVSFTAAAIVALASAGLIAASLIAFGGAVVAVSPDGFRAGEAVLPLWAVGVVTPLDAAATRALAGPQADPRAFLLLRGYIRTAVRVEVADHMDPTPYWLVSTRHPARCAEALHAAKAAPPR